MTTHFTTQEIESPDNATKVANAFESSADILGEKMILNMGPQHPSTHGVLRLVLELDGERVTRCTPDIGYLHRGDEKIAENMTYTQFIPYTDRLDYLAPLANNVAYALAVEKLMGWDVPERTKIIRVISCEMARISSHFLGIGAMALDLGAMTVFLYTFTEREKIYNLSELLTGARFTTSYTRIGGLSRDLHVDFIPALKSFIGQLPPKIDEIDNLLSRNKIFVDRTKDLGVISKSDAISYGITGPCLRASGIDFDLRKAHPYLGYENYEFDVPIGSVGDCYDRYMCRLEEMRQSHKIIVQALKRLDSFGGDTNSDPAQFPIFVPDAKSVPPGKDLVLSKMEELIHHFILSTEGIDAPEGEIYFGAENPKGELGFYINSRKGGTPHRLKIRAPSFVNLSILPHLAKGHLVSDLTAILGSLDFVMGECDR
ncbi:MAG: NADH dehydrogenase (quinone) subunit D [Verrucomicrobiota bacterium]|nr:NADH dehydrogenase (quinone) subunit D [Verrucomicrobiota bacterium]